MDRCILLKKEGKQWWRMFTGTYEACDQERTRIIEARVTNMGDKIVGYGKNSISTRYAVWIIKEIK